MEMKNDTIDAGKFVAFAYKLKDADSGELLFEAKPEAPDTMVYGVTEEVIPGLVATLQGLAAGDRFSVTLPPEVAFGEVLPDMMQQVPLEAFMRDGKMAAEVEEGKALPMMTDTGEIITGKVTKITPEFVEMDFNHPFAGKTVDFEGEVIEVRDATDDELATAAGNCGCGSGCHSEGCGSGCGCHSEGNDAGCGCGDDCGCGSVKNDGDCGCGSGCGCK